jgi:threonine dehydrogenase-like Zn-dependent dehydrogenase
VLGEGVAALLAAQAMSKLNATVRLVGTDPTRLTLAEKWGIRHRHTDDVGRRQDQDVVVDCTSGAAGLDLALRLVRPRGTIILGATPAPPAWEPGALDLSLSARHEIEVVGARGGRVADGVAAIAEGRFDVLGMITRRLKLADGVATLRAAGEPGQVKVVIEV